MANFATAARDRKGILRDFAADRARGGAQGPGGPRAFYLLPGENISRLERLVERLIMQGVTVKRAEEEWTPDGLVSPDGAKPSEELGLPGDFVQDNHSGSVKGVVRGLHFQWDTPMGKLMRVTGGAAFLVAVDIRKGSPTLGQWFGVEVSVENRRQVWAPAGFARGFGVLSDFAEIQYKCTGVYNSKAESGIRWNDPAIGVQWPTRTPILSGKDETAQTLAEWLARPDSANFKY